MVIVDFIVDGLLIDSNRESILSKSPINTPNSQINRHSATANPQRLGCYP
jgi:hypothetical protein